MKVFEELFYGIVLLILSSGVAQHCVAQSSMHDDSAEIISRVNSTAAGELILTQEVVVHASLEDVWNAYTTESGWAKWSTPLVGG